MMDENSLDEALKRPDLFEKYMEGIDKELKIKREVLSICYICDSVDIKIVAEWYDGLPIAICDSCFVSFEEQAELERITQLGRKLKYVMSDVRKRGKKAPVNYQKGVIEQIELICKNLGIETKREYRVAIGRIDLILKTPQSMVAVEVERQKQLAKDKLKISGIGKGAIIFDTYREKINEDFVKQLLQTGSEIKVFV